ncbi:Ketosteroid isomerase-related protein [Rhizobiales bacterium GAS191]|jgi:ketosteroid isomerase-like protein|nr:Ketosteroid isomerase-related protein [Rhizobiales bacterium GAS113]SEC30726.1 Ketosteroid isomerase-related protein [Rhizobiales bacterium GAS191]
MPNRDVVKAFIALVERGQYVEAIEAYYTEDASMQENMQPPRRGRANLAEGERKVMASFREIRTRPVETYFVDGDRVVINWVFDFEGHDGSMFSQDELASQRWQGDKIVEERFYYDPAQRPQISKKSTEQSAA